MTSQQTSVEGMVWKKLQADLSRQKNSPKLPGWRGKVLDALETLYPLHLAEGWDNVGLLIDDLEESKEEGERVVMLTNDLTEATLTEAIARHATLIMTYHPRPFGKFKSITRKDTTQRIVLKCVRAGIAVYSPHTACDNAAGGVNDWLAQGVSGGGVEIKMVKPLPAGQARGLEGVGSGRMFDLSKSVSLGDIVQRVKQHLKLAHVRVAPATQLLAAAGGDLSKALALQHSTMTIAVQAGSGASVLSGCGADCWVTGEASHHEVLEANAAGTTVILCEHSNTERGFLPCMRTTLLGKLEDVEVFVSCTDADPLRVV